MDNLRIAATQSDERQKRLTISSNFLRGTIEGDYSYQTLPASVLNIMRRYIPALIQPARKPQKTENNFHFDLHIYDTESTPNTNQTAKANASQSPTCPSNTT
jgi:hypothetical protein